MRLNDGCWWRADATRHLADVPRPRDLGLPLRRATRDDLHRARLRRRVVPRWAPRRARPALAAPLDTLAVHLLYRGRARAADAAPHRVPRHQGVSALPADLRRGLRAAAVLGRRARPLDV